MSNKVFIAKVRSFFEHTLYLYSTLRQLDVRSRICPIRLYRYLETCSSISWSVRVVHKRWGRWVLQADIGELGRGGLVDCERRREWERREKKTFHLVSINVTRRETLSLLLCSTLNFFSYTLTTFFNPISDSFTPSAYCYLASRLREACKLHPMTCWLTDEYNHRLPNTVNVFRTPGTYRSSHKNARSFAAS
jgi:hypothetical protein